MMIIGFKLALLGISVVFIFLSLLIISIKVSGFIVKNLIRSVVLTEHESGLAKEQDKNLVPVFMAAIDRYKKR